MEDIQIKLTTPELDQLSGFIDKLNAEKYPQGRSQKEKRDIYWIDGYICATVISPNLITPVFDSTSEKQKWWDSNIFVFGSKTEVFDGEIKFDSAEEKKTIELITYRLIAMAIKGTEKENYSPLYEWYPSSSESKLTLAERWCNGFISGFSYLTNSIGLGTLMSKIERGMSPVEDMAKYNALIPIAYCSSFSNFPNQKEQMLAAIPSAVNEFYKICINLPKIDKTSSSTSNDNKQIGRNDPCFCGSGRNIKNAASVLRLP